MNTTAGTAPMIAGTRPVTGLDRLAPLSGVAFFALLASSAATAGETPADHASGQTVLSLFAAHAGAEKLSNLLAGAGVVFLVFFASWLRGYLRDRGAAALASAAYAGALILAVGGAARAGIGWALATGHDQLDPSAAQALNAVFVSHHPAIVGIAIFMFAVWGSTLRTGALPAWLGWAALPIALLAVAPPSLVPLIATGMWMTVAGIVMFLREGRAQAVPA